MEEKHKFTTFDSVSVLVLLTFVLVLVGAIVTNAMIDQRLDQAKLRSKQLAMQILVGGFSSNYSGYGKFNKKSPVLNASESDIDQDIGRDIASVSDYFIAPEGRIGMDPWGAPYYYKISTLQDSPLVEVSVVSSGPDKIRQTFSGDRPSGDDVISIKRTR